METSPTNRLRLAVSLKTTSLCVALDLALSFKRQAEKNKGRGRVFREESTVQICLEGLENEYVDMLMVPYCEDSLKAGRELVLTRSVLTEELPAGIVVGECLGEALSKKLLFALPAGAWIVSANVRDSHRKFWTVSLSSTTDRQRLREQCQSIGAANHQVWVVWRSDDADALQSVAAV